MLGKLCVQVMWASILVLLQLCFLQYVCEFLPDQILLLFVKYIDTFLDVIEPWMVKYLFRCQSLGHILFKHILH